jgi:hypothetical protein
VKASADRIFKHAFESSCQLTTRAANVRDVRNGLPEDEYVAAPYLEILDFRARQCLTQLRIRSHHPMEEID